ncbi:MAG: Gfo/Idh/MocA family protein [Planctomycetota bacterium]
MTRIAIIGNCGHGGGYVLKQLHTTPDAQVVGISPSAADDLDRLAEACAAAGQRPERCGDRAAVLALEPDLVVVDSVIGHHAADCIAALRAGCHVFCEKPCATTLAELDAVEHAWRASGRVCLGMFGLRYQAAIFTAWSLLQERRIGELRLMQAQKSYKLGQRPGWYHDRHSFGGMIPWVGSHAIDWLHWCSASAGTVLSAHHSRRANAGHGDLETSASVHLVFPPDVSGTVCCDYFRAEDAPSHGDDRLRLVGTDGCLEVRHGRCLLDDREQPLRSAPGILADVLGMCSDRPGLMDSAEHFVVTRCCLLARDRADAGSAGSQG